MSYILINPIARLEGGTWTAEIGFPNKLCPHAQQKATIGTSHKAWVMCRPSDTQISAGKKVLELSCLFINFFCLYEQMYIYIYMHLHACMCIYTHTISCNYITWSYHTQRWGSVWLCLPHTLCLPPCCLHQKTFLISKPNS